jgi:hypothetical protein
MTDTTTTDAAAPPTQNAQDGTKTAATVDGTAQPENAAQNAVPGDDNQEDGGAEPRGRAAAYRKRAQEAEAAREAAEARAGELAGQLQQLQRAQVEQAATAAGIKPAALFAVADLAGLLDDAGLPDPAKINAAVKAAREQLGIKPPTTAEFRRRGMLSGAGVPPPRKDGWAAAFARRDQ